MANLWQPDFVSMNSSNPFVFSSDSTKDLAMFSGTGPAFAPLAKQSLPQIESAISGLSGHGPDPQAVHIIRQATHGDLMQARNSTYMQLFYSKMQLEGQISTQSTVIKQLEWMIQSFKDSKMIHRNSLDRLDVVPSMQQSDLFRPQSSPLQIPPSPPLVSRDEFLDAKFWKSDSWQEYCSRRTDAPKLGFVTNEDGDFVGPNRLKNMSETAKKLWAHLHHHRLAPATWRLISQEAYDYYSNSMRTAFVEFHLCENDWKVSMFGTIRFPDWSNGPRASGKLTRAIPSIDTHTSTIQRKRQHEKGESTKNPSKRPRNDIKLSNVVDLTTDTDRRVAQQPSTVTVTQGIPPLTKLQPVDIMPCVSAPTEMTSKEEFTDMSTTDIPAVSVGPAVVLQVPKDPGMASASTTTPFDLPSTSVQNSVDGPGKVHEVISTTESIIHEPDKALPESTNAPEPASVQDNPVCAVPGPSTAVTNVPSRMTRKRKVNMAFADLEIPGPAEAVPYIPPSADDVAKAKQKKPARKAVPKPTDANTARNLFLIDFRNQHGDNATAEDFNKAWKDIRAEELKEYQARVNTRKAELKAAAKKNYHNWISSDNLMFGGHWAR